MRKIVLNSEEGSARVPETVEKQNKALHSTEQMGGAQPTVNNHVKEKIRNNFFLQQILFSKISVGFFVLCAVLYSHVNFPTPISVRSFLEEREFSYTQPAGECKCGSYSSSLF